MQSELEVCPRSRAAWSFIVVCLGIVLALPKIAIGPAGLLGVAALSIFVHVAAQTDEGARPKMFALTLLMVLQLGFWIAFARIVQLAAVVAIGGSTPMLEIWIFAPLIVISPVATKLWSWLGERGLEPSHAAKISLGYLGLAASCKFLAASVTWSLGLGVLVALAALSFAALCLGPACVAAIFDWAPAGQRGTLVASWLLSFAFARALGGWGPREDAFDLCLALGFGAVAAAVLSSFMWHGFESLTSTRVPIGAGDHSLGAGSLAPDSVASGSLSVGSGSAG